MFPSRFAYIVHSSIRNLTRSLNVIGLKLLTAPFIITFSIIFCLTTYPIPVFNGYVNR